jgi:hypothetical protein
MVKPIDFKVKFEQLKALLIERNEPVLDPEVMTELGFSPPSWKTWKSQFITMSQKAIEATHNESGVITDVFYIKYDKKQKTWEIDHVETVEKKQE